MARDIANVLGAKETKQGYIEGNGYQVTWTFGHLCELKNPHEYFDRWKRWDLWDLPMIPARFGIRLKDDEGVQRQFAVIEKLMQAADAIINCGDAGQEGELIQRWVMQKAGAKCPVKRLWISSLTEEAIREGFNNLKDQIEYQSLYEAGLCRAIGDWTLGMNATRLYTLKYGQQKQVLSIGRVQTPTLALIVRRQQEIENFVPKQSWVLSTLYRDTKFTAIAHDEEAEAEDAAEVKAAAEQGKTLKGKGPIYKQIEYQTEEEGRAVLQAIQNQPFTVTDIQKKKGTEAPPRLYDLTSLQVDCNRKFGYSAEQTLQLIQSLYEKKFTTYPRVDTTFLSDDIYAKCPQTLRGLKGYEQYTTPLEGKKLPKSKKVFDSSKVTDHHAIIPTGVPAISLTDMERRVYDLVTRAFIAVFYPDCKFETTTVFGEVALNTVAEGESSGDTVLFRTSGRTILDEGWKVIYKKNAPENSDDEEAAAEDDHSLPVFRKAESGPHLPMLMEKWTQPPKPYTEATLLRAMETAGKFVDNEELRDAMKENGIGRPSTRAAIIEPENSFTNCGFGRIFGREKVCLIFHFAFAVGVWIQWLIVYDYQRGVTLLNRTKWLMLSIGIAAVLSAVFLVLSKEYRSHKILAALAMMMALANGFAFVWVVNVECDTAPAEKYDVTVTNNHLEKRLKSIGAHYENYLTVRYADGSILDLYEPYDFDFYEEGDRLTVIHHRGVLGIKWAELTQK